MSGQILTQTVSGRISARAIPVFGRFPSAVPFALRYSFFTFYFPRKSRL